MIILAVVNKQMLRNLGIKFNYIQRKCFKQFSKQNLPFLKCKKEVLGMFQAYHLWGVIMVFGTFVLLVYYTEIPLFDETSYTPQSSLPSSEEGFLIKTKGCRIPYMDPFDSSVLQFIENETVPNCNDGIPPLFDSDYTSIFLVNSSLPAYLNDTNLDLTCCYSVVKREQPKHQDRESMKVSENCKILSLGYATTIEDEYIKVTCKNSSSSVIYVDYFSFVPIKNSGTRIKEDGLNVVVLGLDAVSRVNFLRQMPKTSEYLNNISAVSMKGYNKVGDNTFPNLIPVLTGLNESQLSCWEGENYHFDNCSFIWDDYKWEGFLTSYSEDAAWMGLFNYVKRGFGKQPTDYFWGSFDRFVESEIGNEHRANVEQCVGSRQVYKTLLEYVNKFIIRLNNANKKYFSFNWGVTLGHDILNMPSIGDETYYNFFKNLKESNQLNNTVFIFMSDHGIRWGAIRETFQGRMEERLPFLYMILPDWFQIKYPYAYSKLLKNTRRLTTPFDLHETLKDLINPSVLTEQYLKSKELNTKARGHSLFTEISPTRTCETADIAAHWCTCQKSQPIDSNSELIRNVSNFTVQYMNSLLIGYGQCAELTLKQIKNAQVMSHGDDIRKGKFNFEDYTITIQTEPGDGVFEATVRRDLDKNELSVLGTISRLNLYGKQSLCVTDFHLKLYCFCKNLLD